MYLRLAWHEGYDRGYEAATNCEREDGEGWTEAAYAAEEHSRQYSPFEFLAHDINASGDMAERPWEAYDDGVTAGIKAGLKKRGV